MPLTADTHAAALELAREHGFAFYDALIVVAAIEADCDILYSEDMQHGRAIGGLTIVNPLFWKAFRERANPRRQGLEFRPCAARSGRVLSGLYQPDFRPAVSQDGRERVTQIGEAADDAQPLPQCGKGVERGAGLKQLPPRGTALRPHLAA